MTRNGPSPLVPPRTSVRMRRIRALSSTTRTVGFPSDDFDITPHRPDFDMPVRQVETHRPALLAADGLLLDRDRGDAQRVARGHDVALPHLQRAGRHQR